MNISSLSSVDFYVSVIDNYGDMGFAVNLAESLHARYPDTVFRFFSDNEPLFRIFVPGPLPAWMEYYPLEIFTKDDAPAPSTLILSFFDYRIPKAYLARFSFQKTIVICSYFLLHAGLESLHGTKYALENGHDTCIHFVPSLLPGWGGVIMNPRIESQRRENAQKTPIEMRKSFLEQRGLSGADIDICEKKWISVFVYQDTLKQILPIISADTSDTVFWICGNASWIEESSRIRTLPFLSLEEYGVFLSLADANIVRGENSLCQALLSEKPVLWDIYKESNGAHAEKIADYLLFLDSRFPGTDWSPYVRMMREFNGWDRVTESFSDFVSRYSEYADVFHELSEYTKRECNLVQKLENILA